MSELYNEALKNRYLNEFENEDSRVVIKYVFVASRNSEENVLERDLYNFNKEQIGTIIQSMSPKTLNTARSYTAYIRQYITWAIKNGYRENNLNPLDTANKEWYSQFIDKTYKIHFSDEEFEDFIESFENAVDQAMFQLFYEGAMGEDFSEIKNLNYYDIDWNKNTIELKDDASEEKRKLKISDRCVRYLKNAYAQEKYMSYNVKTKNFNEKELFTGDFIFRNVKHHRTKDIVLSTGVIYTRINAIKEIHGLDYLTPNGIRQSGMLKEAAEVLQEEGELKYKQFAKLGEKFNVPMFNNNGMMMYNTTLIKTFITSENLKELYDIDIDL
ncbi:hypothetical protein V1503_19220 [Bacillus sp. SCS-151]|uniref:phage lytic cycle repressor MrpR family protein n=1 Tax=Nanhaiella sioensis TaxID=3115293 RepID=UPI00397CC2C9